MNYISLVLLFFMTNDWIEADVTDEARGHARLGFYSFINMKWCGQLSPKNVPNEVPSNRIIDGDLAREGEFPWMASLHYHNRSHPNADTFLCGGALISDYWVLTAAHCMKSVRELSEMKVYLGSVEKYQYYNFFQVTSYALHPHWDLALLRLRTEALPEFMENHFIINYICLPQPQVVNYREEVAVISGFGFVDKPAVTTARTLRKAVVTIAPNDKCIEMNYSIYHICGIESVHMTCFGDSGSPLVQFDQNRAVVIGIVGGGKSMTDQICGPGLLYYYRISLFIDWIAWVIEGKAPNDRINASQKTDKETEKEKLSSNANQNNWSYIKEIVIFSLIINIIRFLTAIQ